MLRDNEMVDPDEYASIGDLRSMLKDTRDANRVLAHLLEILHAERDAQDLAFAEMSLAHDEAMRRIERLENPLRHVSGATFGPTVTR